MNNLPVWRTPPPSSSVKSRQPNGIKRMNADHSSLPGKPLSLDTSPGNEHEVFEDVSPLGSYIPSSPTVKGNKTPVPDPENIPNDTMQSTWNHNTDNERSKRQWVLFDRATGKEHKRKMTFRATLLLAKFATMLNLQEPCTGPSAILPWLFIGNARDAQNVHLLRDKLRITHVLNTAASCPKHHEDKFIYLHLPLIDTDAQNLDQAFSLAATFITDAKISGGRVFVHCIAGISRSVSVVLAYLIQKGSDILSDGEDLTLDEAFALVRYRRPQALPNIGFRKQLALYEAKVRGKSSILRRIGRFPWSGDQFNDLPVRLMDSQAIRREARREKELLQKKALRQQFGEDALAGDDDDVENPPVFHPSRSPSARRTVSNRSNPSVTSFEPTAFSAVPPIYTKAPLHIEESETRPERQSARRIEVRASRRNIPLSPTSGTTHASRHERTTFGFTPDTPRSYYSSGSQRRSMVYPASPVSFFSVTQSPRSGAGYIPSSPYSGRLSRRSSAFSSALSTSMHSISVNSHSSDFSHGFSWSQSNPTSSSMASLGIRF